MVVTTHHSPLTYSPISRAGRPQGRCQPCNRTGPTTHRISALFLFFHVVAKQQILIADIQFSVCNHGMRPSGGARTIRLRESSALDVLFRIRLDQGKRATLVAVVEPAISVEDRPFARPSLFP